MKKYLFLLWLIVFGINYLGYSQKSLKVSDFRLDPQDITALTFLKKDINGTPCGLIKIGLPVPNATFDGSIISSEYKNGEWWVYMCKGAKWIKIMTPNYPPLEFEFGERIQSKMTYVMVVEEPKIIGKPPRPSKLKPEKRTFEMDLIAGGSLGLAMDLTWSYFLIGLGYDWILFVPGQTTKSTLVNSGYTGNFTKTVTTDLSGTCLNVFLTPGVYFKYFSVSCKVGLLCGTTVNRSAQYEGWGYGLLDGDLDEYWGSYELRSLSNTTAEKEFHLTLTPQVKGYIPLGGAKTTSLSVGLGYSFIPSLNYYSWLSGSVGMHFRF